MRVLLVDDDEQNVDFVRRGMKAEGYAIEVARTGQDAIALGAEGKFRAIILALSLPDINGRQVCERLRNDGIDTPILILTARANVQDEVAGLRSGANDYMIKPFKFEDLLARIEVLVHLRRDDFKLETTEFRIADLLLNRQTHEVSRGDILIDLTPKEFALLEYFMLNHGKLLSRPRILEQVWGCCTDPLTNVVDVYIRHLRLKIDDDFELKLIKTVRGYGYKIDDF